MVFKGTNTTDEFGTISPAECSESAFSTFCNEKERERERDRQTDRQTDREKEAERERDRDIDRGRERERERWRGRGREIKCHGLYKYV